MKLGCLRPPRLLVWASHSHSSRSAATRSKFDSFFAAFEAIDSGKKKSLTAVEMQQGFSKVRYMRAI